MIKTITLTGEVTAVEFNADGKNPYFYTTEKYCWIKNKSDGSIYASLLEEFEAGDDDVLEISEGESGLLILDKSNRIYLSGEGEAIVQTTSAPVCPFKSAAKGGDGGGGAATYAEYHGSSGTIENTVEAPCYVTECESENADIVTTVNDDILIPFAYELYFFTDTSGVEVTIEALRDSNNNIILNGTANVNCSLVFAHGITKEILDVGESYYFITTPPPGNAYFYIQKDTSPWTRIATSLTSYANSFTFANTDFLDENTSFFIYIPQGTIFDNYTFNPILIKQNGASKISINQDTLLPTTGLKTFDSRTNIFSDSEITLKYYSDEESSIPAAAFDNGHRNDILFVGASYKASSAAIIKNYRKYKYIAICPAYANYNNAAYQFRIPILLTKQTINTDSQNWTRLCLNESGTIFQLWYKVTGDDFNFYHTDDSHFTVQVIGVI